MKIGHKREVPTGMKTSFSLVAGALLASGLQAEKTEQDWDTELARKLISYETQNLKDLAVLQLEKMIKLYPEQKDLINLLMAESYHLQNQNKSFEQTIAKVAKNSPLYSEALLLRSQRALKRGKSDEAIALYAEYFKLNPKAPEEKDAQDAWKKIVNLYSSVLARAGKTQEAQEVKDMLAQVAVSKFEIRKIAFEKARLELDAIENEAEVSDPVFELNGKNAYLKVPGVKLPAKYTIEGLYFQESNETDSLCVVAVAGNLKKYHVTLVTSGSGGKNKNNKLVAVHSKNPASKDHTIQGGNYNDGQWHHFAMTFDGKALKLYRDGEVIAEKTDRVASIGTPKTDFYFGYNCAKGYFKGQMDNLRLWNRALDAGEIEQNMFNSLSSGQGLVFEYNFNNKKSGNIVSSVGNVKAEVKSAAWKDKKARNLKAIKNIATLQQNTFQNDGISALSQVEMARAYWLTGDYKNAVKIIRQGAELMLNLEKAIRKDKRQNINASPLAGAFYYYGMSYKSIADASKKSGDTKKANKAYKGAVDKLASVVKTYPDSPYTAKCRIALSQVKDAVTELGWTEEQLASVVEAIGSGVVAAAEEGNAFFRAGDYAKAVDSYRKALTASMRGKEIKEILYYMTLSMVKDPARQISNTGYCWEAEAVADYLLTAYPTADEAVKICLTMGSMYGGELKAKKNSLTDDQKAKLTDSTLRWFGEFINMRPKDEMAPVLKYKIAENSRGKTQALIAAMKDVKDDAAKVTELKAQLNRALYKLVPQYVDLIENYGDTEQAIKSRFILGKIYSQLEEHKKAAAAYLDYVAVDKDPKAKLSAVNFSAAVELMKDGQPEAAVKQYQATIDMIKKSGKKDKESRELIEDSYSFMAVANDMTGDKALKEINDLEKAARDQNSLIRNAERSIRSIEKKVAEMKEAKAKTDKEFREIIEALEQAGVSEVDPGIEITDSDEVKASKRKDAARKTARLRKEYYAKLSGEVAGEKIQLDTDLESAKTEYQRASDEFNKNSVTKSSAARDIKNSEALIRVMDIRIAGVKKDKERAGKDVEASRQKLAQLEKDLEAVRDLMQSPDKKERDEAMVRQVELLDQLRPARQAEKTAVDKWQDVILAEQVDVKRYQQNKEDAQAKLVELKAALKNATRSEERLTQLKALYELKINAFNAGVVKNKLQAQMLKAKDRTAFEKKVATATETYKKLLTGANKKETEIFDLDNKFATQDIADAKALIAQAKVKITELEKAQEPFRQVYTKYKTEAVKYYDQFLKIYPKSQKHGANNLAKAGKIYIDFEQFDKAAGYLNRLKKDYPNDPLVKSTTFDLGDAFVKIGRYDEAVKIYNEILKTPKEYTPAKLAGLQKRLLLTFEEKGEDAVKLLDVSAKAGEALHTKIMKNKSDKALYAQRELCLFRIGEAYFNQKKYENALVSYGKLLGINSKTGFLFQVKYHQGIAFRDKKNPDLTAAASAFNEVTRFGDKAGMTMTYKAMVESAVASAAKQNYAGVKEATSVLELVLAGFNPDNQELKPVYERAYNMFTKYLAQIGETEKAKKFVDEYLKNFPEGKYARTIKRLPAKKYSAPVVEDKTENK